MEEKQSSSNSNFNLIQLAYMITSLTVILQWFLRGKKPTQSHFEATFRSFWHKEESIPTNKIDGLEQSLNQKAEKIQFTAHLTDKAAHSNLFVVKENTDNKQNSLATDNTGIKFPTVDAVNKAIGNIGNAIDIINGQIL